MKHKIIFAVLLVLLVLSLIFPIYSHIYVKDFDGKETAIEIENETYTFSIKPKGDNLETFMFRLATYGEKYTKGKIHYKLVDNDNNTIFDVSKDLSDVKDSIYIEEAFERQKDSSNKTYSFIVYFDEYVKGQRVGIWGNDKGSPDNFLADNTGYGLELYTKENVPNTTISWFILIIIAIYTIYLILEKDFKDDKDKKKASR